jgi:potassium-transporting ATPase KdpC subunit
MEQSTTDDIVRRETGGRKWTRRCLRYVRQCAVVLVAMIAIAGVVYPLFVTGIGQAFFHEKANGSMMVQSGEVVGSSLIGQSFDDPGYFWSRPSATSGSDYNATASGGSNQGPSNPDRLSAVSSRIAALRAADPGNTGPVPMDLVTSSGSGLDPHISPAAAEYQVERVARARGISAGVVRQLVEKYTEKRTLGFLGEPRVNVLQLNLALDSLTK